MKTVRNIPKHPFVAIALVSLGGLSKSLGDDTPDVLNLFPEQAVFPIIVLQPLDQLVPAGGTVSFEVKAENGPLTYQWYRNGSALSGQTNTALVISNATISDVGLYACSVARESEAVPTRAAQLMVYSSRPSTSFSSGSDQMTTMSGGSGSVTVWSTPVVSSGSSGSCPGSYAGYANYTKTLAQGWGWAPTSGTTTHTATDLNRMDTKVQYSGKLGDGDCNQTSVSVPDPTYSTKYRFTIYFTNNVPTNAYSITLDGFDP